MPDPGVEPHVPPADKYLTRPSPLGLKAEQTISLGRKLGALLIMLGIIIAGIGLIDYGVAEASLVSCQNSPPTGSNPYGGCPLSQVQSALNGSAYLPVFLGVGMLVGGLGVGIYLMSPPFGESLGMDFGDSGHEGN